MTRKQDSRKKITTGRPRGRKSRAGRGTLRLLLTCVGRRVELIRAFHNAAESLGIPLEIHGADASPMSPGYRLVDKAHTVPTIASGQYIDALADLVRRRRISALIPLIDTELLQIAQARERFADLGCRAIISSPAVIDICRNKLET